MVVAYDAAVPDRSAHHGAASRRIIRSYDSFVVRAYCHVRFRIIRIRFLEEIAQFIPPQGTALEIGCGFGLFGMYFSETHPELSIRAIDVDAQRIEAAKRAQSRLGIDNIGFEVGDARTISFPEKLDAVYMLDIVHHLERDDALDLLRSCRDALKPGGVLIVKDVDTRPRFKMAFTWLLDVLMTKGERPHYWSRHDLAAVLRSLDFEVFQYAMVDVLPYPHQLYVCRVPAATT